MLELLIILTAFYLFAIRCRSGHPGLKDLQGWSYAHRGLHSEGIPENSMAAFRAALDHGYGIELDIHLLKDGNLAVMHDSLLNRTTGQAGRIEDLTTEDLKNYRLEGTEETIPEFMDVLTLHKNRPDIIRGQLTENFFKSRSDLPDYLKFALQHCLTNIICVPDFVAYKFADRNDTVSVRLCKKLWKAQTVTWTLKTKEEYDTAVQEGWIPIFENFIP